MNDRKVDISTIVTKYYVKYNRLNQLIPVVFSGSNAHYINLYIDLYGLYRTMFSRSYQTSVRSNSSFTAAVINMCAHYRRYFKSLQVYPKIFLISSYNIPAKSTKIIANYNKSMVEKVQTKEIPEIVELNEELLKILCPYLPDIHFIHTEFESSGLIMNIIEKELREGNNSPNIIISDDIYPIQITSYYDETVFLRPIKNRDGDMSEMTLRRNHRDYARSFWGLASRRRGNSDMNVSNINIHPINFSLFSALNRFPERSIPLLLGESVANRVIFDVVQDSSTKIDIDTLYKISNDAVNIVSPALSTPRYQVLDAKIQAINFAESVESMTLNYTNLQDPQSVNMIVSKYFDAEDSIDIYGL